MSKWTHHYLGKTASQVAGLPAYGVLNQATNMLESAKPMTYGAVLAECDRRNAGEAS